MARLEHPSEVTAGTGPNASVNENCNACPFLRTVPRAGPSGSARFRRADGDADRLCDIEIVEKVRRQASRLGQPRARASCQWDSLFVALVGLHNPGAG